MEESCDTDDTWMTTMSAPYMCEKGECSVQSCLNQFTAPELLTGNNKVGCELCTKRHGGPEKKTVYTNAMKQLLIYNPPAVLILHLKRFQVCLFYCTCAHLILSQTNCFRCKDFVQRNCVSPSVFKRCSIWLRSVRRNHVICQRSTSAKIVSSTLCMGWSSTAARFTVATTWRS